MVKGSGNVVSDNLQEQSSQLVSNCLMSGSETAKSVNDVTNTINQHSTYKSDNPFAFITDAIEGVFRSAFAVAAVVFIAVVILVLVFEVGGRKKKSKETGAAPAVIIAPPLASPPGE
jgi:type IV secretory pathway VirB6-like protein